MESRIVEVYFYDVPLLVPRDLHVFLNELPYGLNTVAAKIEVHLEFYLRRFARIDHNLVR